MKKNLFFSCIFIVGCHQEQFVPETTPVKVDSGKTTTHLILVVQEKQIHVNEEKQQQQQTVAQPTKTEEVLESAKSIVKDGAVWAWDKSKNAYIEATSEESKKKMSDAADSAKKYLNQKIEDVKQKINLK